ncbi:DUF3080 family protein [Marinomonas agarivorans]|nr:DUF3080 family protein [Marinomonas agarivorans]
MKPSVSFFSLFLLTLLLSSCAFTPVLTDKLQAYIESLNRYSELTIKPVSQSFNFIHLPARDERLQALSTFDVSLIEFLSLQDCDIGYHLGVRNSLLGKVMTHSQRLVYETDIIRAIENCDLLVNNPRPKLIDKIKKVAQQKRDELYKAYGNAIWGGTEMERFFSLSNGHLPMTIKRTHVQPLQRTLEKLTTFAEDLPTLPKLRQEKLEYSLKILYHSEYGGQLLLTLVLLTDTLQNIAVSLDAVPIDDAFCLGPARFLQQQMNQHYITIIQPYMARLNTTAYYILPQLSQLGASSQNMTESMRSFLGQLSQEDSHSLWGQYQAASQYHARAWDRILRQCQLFN